MWGYSRDSITGINYLFWVLWDEVWVCVIYLIYFFNVLKIYSLVSCLIRADVNDWTIFGVVFKPILLICLIKKKM